MAQQEKIHSPVQRLVIISNRLPVVIEREGETLQVTPGCGGLVTALAPVLRDRGGLWLGWSGSSDRDKEQEIVELITQAQAVSGFTCCPISLMKEEVDRYYHGFSNEIIWPLFHDLVAFCNFVPAYWYGYQEVNRKFAEKAKQCVHEGDFIWVHDYHLMLLGEELRKAGVTAKKTFFLHIPFPPLDIFIKLPWRFQVIRALLEYDLIGFQTVRDKRNFNHCVKMLLPNIVSDTTGSLNIYNVDGREVCVGAFPIGINYDEFANCATSQEVAEKAWHYHEVLADRTLILSIDRLDYTKGIPYRLEAVRELLKRYPDVCQKVTMIQVTVPSRVDIPQYFSLRDEVNRLVGEINSEYSQNGWVPIHFFYRSLTKVELVAYYRTSEVALVTSLKDGMNLVAKEYVASNIDQNGVLILSEFAGASAQLNDGALLVNPYDIEGLAEIMYKAIIMPKEERKERMKRLQHNVKRYNIFWWVESFLSVALNKELQAFPVIKEYIPKDMTENPM